MEEADLLKERLQFITDKRRIQEEIAQKRRQIEEEKLKLQYIKKKALRDQWLMDGLSQQSEEEQEALRLQNQDEQQQSQELQSNILRMEQQIQDLETQELNMSANEEAVLRRLKEVERTAEDIIKKAASSAESDGKEVNQGCSTADNHNSFSVTMETAEQLEPATGCEVEGAVNDSPEPVQDFSEDDHRACSETNSSAPPGGQLGGPTAGTEEPNPPVCGGPEEPHPPGSTGPKEPEEPHQGLKEEPVREELNRNESVTSSVSDSPSSADSVYENEAHRKRQDTSEQDPETDRDPETHRNPDTDQDPEPELEPEPELDQDPEPDRDPVLQQHSEHLEEDSLTGHSLLREPQPLPDPDPEQDPEPDLMVNLQVDEDPDLDSFPQPEPDPDLDLYPHPELDPDLDSFPQPELNPDLDSFPQPDLDLDLYPDPEPDPELGLYSELEGDGDLHPEDDGYENLPVYPDDDPEVLEVQFDPPIVEESVLEQRIREEVMSDGSNESCQDQDHNLDLDQDCEDLIESDEETDEKWRTIFSSSINKEDDDSYLDNLELSAQDLFVQKVEVMDFAEQPNDDFEEVSFQVPRVDKVLEQPEDVVSFPVPPQEVKYNPLGLQGLSKISEDESETGRDAGQNQAKKLPKDFCVIQETRSENVSTEHVDFQLARKQWREMEEQTKSKIVLPTKKQPTFHSSHSFMYTPVRNIERVPRKANDLESLNLVGEYPHTQFSPCSEDSGLDDSSFRSPYDDPETPVEREIRLSLEREESFKRERALSRMGKSTDCTPSRGMPRSISTPLTPSFIITSSSTSEPGGDSSSSRDKHGKDDSSQWRSEDGGSSLIILETSNLIIRSASEFSLSQACDQPQEKSFLNNPFFKLRSRSSVSLVDEEIRMVKQREEELKKERENLYGRERIESERNNRLDTLTFTHSVDVPMKCKSSPSSPMKTAYRMDRSTLSCDHRFPDVYAGGRRKSAMALRWEAGEFTKND